MFEQENMIEAKTGEINIVDFSFECFYAMIEYFYFGDIIVDSSFDCFIPAMKQYFYIGKFDNSILVFNIL
uniref:BTB domain-containing protein n=1 Tax=Meloidogyne hapla TaxID=6305 RepID=A0A1I8BA36_MELHA